MPQFTRIATLGEPPVSKLTSSYFVAEKRNLASHVIGCETFELALMKLEQGEVDAALVAGAYPRIRDFIMSSRFVCSAAFVERIPSLVLCGLQHRVPDKIDKIFLHPATIPLLQEVSITYSSSLETSSTASAALAASKDLGAIAICNELASAYYKLNVHQILRKDLLMPFVVFQLVS